MCPLAPSPAQINPTPIGKASAICKRLRIARIQNPCYDGTCHDRGEVTERLKVLASKASVRETVPWVRIPPSPPLLLFSCTYKTWCLSWCLLCTAFRPTTAGIRAYRHVKTRQRLRQRKSRQHPQKSQNRQELEPLPCRHRA